MINSPSALRARKFPAYQANIIAYTVAAIGAHASRRMDLEAVWKNQAMPAQLEELVSPLTVAIDNSLRTTAGDRMVSEWSKREDCWRTVVGDSEVTGLISGWRP